MWFVKRRLLLAVFLVGVLLTAGFTLYRHVYLPRYRPTLGSPRRSYEVHYVWAGGIKSLRIIREPSGVEEQDKAWRSRVTVEAERIVRELVAREGFTRAFGRIQLAFWGYEEPYLPDMRPRVGDSDLIKDPDVTPLMRAVTRRDSKAVDYLIKDGAEANTKDQKGWTALMIAAGGCWNDFAVAEGCWNDIVKRLLAAGADVNAQNREGETPLMLAAACGDLQMVASLIAEGADVNARTSKGYTALTYSAYSHSPGARDMIMVILKKAGARW